MARADGEVVGVNATHLRVRPPGFG